LEESLPVAERMIQMQKKPLIVVADIQSLVKRKEAVMVVADKR
jgi:hypothetical protein